MLLKPPISQDDPLLPFFLSANRPDGDETGAQVLIYGDCAVNVHPSSNELAQIAVTSADTAAAFGIEPRVALLSYSTFGSGSGPEVDRVRMGPQCAEIDVLITCPSREEYAVDPNVNMPAFRPFLAVCVQEKSTDASPFTSAAQDLAEHVTERS